MRDPRRVAGDGSEVLVPGGESPEPMKGSPADPAVRRSGAYAGTGVREPEEAYKRG